MVGRAQGMYTWSPVLPLVFVLCLPCQQGGGRGQRRREDLNVYSSEYSIVHVLCTVQILKAFRKKSYSSSKISQIFLEHRIWWFGKHSAERESRIDVNA